ncbi:MAG TPA: aminoglycoside phosphotransferase family protein [bacterium]|nr:aminoglycoside phosphotransferase family protein [bacterium]HPN43558.1 aminoglycoside phosphotransferase family protein [bacterium]
MDTIEILHLVLSHWNLHLKCLHPEISVAGSSERTAYRTVVETQQSHFYIVEEILAAQLDHKRLIQNILFFLHSNRLQFAEPYIRSNSGNAICEVESRFWQIIPFIDGIPLVRPAYIDDTWRGREMAHFLTALKDSSAGIESLITKPPFSIKEYVIDFIKKLQIHNPELTGNVDEIFLHLEKTFFDRHDELEIGFCHGDYHPLNIIWSETGIRRVIDWEFAGFKPVLYDIANMLGCLGMEHPRSLVNAVTRQFLHHLFKSKFLNINHLECLPEFILALRFAWLAEWLRKTDTEMIKLELTYMFLLLDNREKILKNWCL